MQNNISELVFILDKSGSMNGNEKDVIGSFNTTIKEQKEKDYRSLVTTVLFSNDYQIVHDRIDIDKIENMKDEDYRPSGSTALIDAIGSTIEHIKTIHKYVRKEDVPSKTVFVIMTDGLENASHKYSSEEVKKMIKAEEETGWEFLFLGANIDAVETARNFGINESRAANFHADGAGIRKAAKSMRNFMDIAANPMMSAKQSRECLDEADWRKEVDEDFNSRN